MAITCTQCGDNISSIGNYGTFDIPVCAQCSSQDFEEFEKGESKIKGHLFQKLKIIFSKFIFVLVGFTSLYSLVTYLIIHKYELLTINEDMYLFWIPFVFPFILLLLFMRKEISILNFEDRKGDDRFIGAFYLFTTLAVSIPNIILQHYFVTSTGTLTTIKSINAIAEKPRSRCYQIDEIFLDKSNAGAEAEYSVSGRANEDLYFTLYIATPLLNSNGDTLKGSHHVWFGTEYTKTISNRLEQNKKEEQWKRFQDESIANYNYKDHQSFYYLSKVSYGKDYKAFHKAAVKTGNIDSKTKIIVLKPILKPYSGRNGLKLHFALGTLIGGMLIVFLSIMWTPLDKIRYENFLKGQSFNEENWREYLAFFIPSKQFFFTPLIVDINVIIFIIMVFNGFGIISLRAEILLPLGANYRPLVMEGQYWRLFTSIFLHGGIMHVLMNCYGLYFVGVFLEPVIGKWKFLLSYLITGIAGSIASIYWHEATVSIGASGAIFGIFGVFIALLTTPLFEKGFKKVFLTHTLIYVSINLVIGISGGIDNAAHIGGLLSGLILGYVLYFIKVPLNVF